MRDNIIKRLLGRKRNSRENSWLRSVVSGSLYKISDVRGDTSLSDIRTQIDTMRALARDSQISTALSYYATDATTVNSGGKMIWATANDKSNQQVADIINALFDRWEINKYARDHILELATIGNLYIPSTDFYKEDVSERSQRNIALDNNTIVDTEYDIIPSTKIPPEDVLHLWLTGKPNGFIYQPSDDKAASGATFPESSIIHFSLGGLLGDYTISGKTRSGDDIQYDIQFSTPLMAQAVQPTQTLSLLEDAIILSSLTRVVRFINVDCSDAEEEEIQDALQQIKDAIEQQLSINTAVGDVQSFVNPQSPNNLIYLPKVDGNDPISITDLNMAETNDQDSKLLEYYQDKKLSVLGVPKEAMNFSSNEGLGGAGSVLAQRSALYANSLQRLETAYMEGWKTAINNYFVRKNMSGLVNTYTLHMNPIITTQSTVVSERRDAALSQASQLVQLFKDMGVTQERKYTEALTEILSDVFPSIGADAVSLSLDLESGGESNEF